MKIQYEVEITPAEVEALLGTTWNFIREVELLWKKSKEGNAEVQTPPEAPSEPPRSDYSDLTGPGPFEPLSSVPFGSMLGEHEIEIPPPFKLI